MCIQTVDWNNSLKLSWYVIGFDLSVTVKVVRLCLHRAVTALQLRSYNFQYGAVWSMDGPSFHQADVFGRYHEE